MSYLLFYHEEPLLAELRIRALMRNSFHENIVNVAMFVCEITLASGIQGEKH